MGYTPFLRKRQENPCVPRPAARRFHEAPLSGVLRKPRGIRLPGREGSRAPDRFREVARVQSRGQRPRRPEGDGSGAGGVRIGARGAPVPLPLEP